MVSTRNAAAVMSRTPSVTVQESYFIVIDDVLPDLERDSLWNYFQLQPFQRVDALGMQGQWPLEDSGVLRGPTVGWEQAWDAQYPTKSPIDDVMRAVVEAAPAFAATIGERGRDWTVFNACATLTAAGQGRLWHRDGDDDRGSWVYYAHPEWNIEWGGELFIAPDTELPAELGVYLHRLRPMDDRPTVPWKSHLDNADASRMLMERGMGSFVLPKPNRLVVVKGSAPRSLAKVRLSAGRHVHATLGGVFKQRR